MILDSSTLLWLELPDHQEVSLALRLSSVLERVLRREPVEGPDVLAYEVGHTLFRRRKKDAGASLQDRWARYERLLRVVELIPPGPPLLHETARIADRAGVSFYDASFLAAAAVRRVPLCTADAGLASHAQALAIPCYLLPRDFEALERDYPWIGAGT